MGDFCLAGGIMAEALAADDGEVVGGGGFGKTAEAVRSSVRREITPLKRGVNERRLSRGVIWVRRRARDSAPYLRFLLAQNKIVAAEQDAGAEFLAEFV